MPFDIYKKPKIFPNLPAGNNFGTYSLLPTLQIFTFCKNWVENDTELAHKAF